jgi:hypothetical protein
MQHPCRTTRLKGSGLRLGFLILFLGLTAGCGPRSGDISGKVLYRGQPLPGGAVTYFPDSGKGAFTTRIQPDGSYHLLRVPAGKMHIAIAPLAAPAAARRVDPEMQAMAKAIKSGKQKLSPEAREKMPPAMRAAIEEPAAASPGQSMVIPPQYTHPEKSGLEYTVTAGSQTHDIELK